MKKSPIVIILMVLFCASTVFALANPATVYCNEMNKEFGGYSYVMQSDAQSNVHGVCIMPDGTQCDAWAFLDGRCGKDFSYCAKNGDGTTTVTNGSSEYAACIISGGKTKALAMDSQNEIPVMDMMNLTAKLGSDITPRAVLTQMNQMVSTSQSSKQMYNSQSMYNASAYSSWDWRNPPASTIYTSSNYLYFESFNGWMTSVKDQGQCGSCWSFGTLGAMEAKYDLGLNESRLQPDLSEQDEVSCDYSCGYDEDYSGACQYGCSGGYPNVSLWNIQYNGGVVDERCFPYTATNNACSNICPDHSSRSWTITGSQSFSSPTNAQLEQLLIDNGPLTILVDASNWYYYGGVLTCTSPSTYMDHAVVLVGYNDTGNPTTSYWIIKNSWGSGWGENGYIRIEFGCNGVGLWVYSPNGVTPPNYAPTIVVNSPTQGTVQDSGPVQFNFTVNNRNSPTSTCDLIVDGDIVNTTLANSGSATIMSYLAPFGEEANWSIRCWETGFGIISSTPTQNLNLYITIQSPSSSFYNVSTIPLDYSTANPDTCWYSLDGNPDVILPGCGNTTLDSLPDGTHSIIVSYNDTNGTIHFADVNFTVDTVPPVVALSSPADLSTSHSPTVDFNFTAMDNLSSTMDCSMFLDGVLNQTNSSTMNDIPTVFQVSGIAYGNHTWYVQCSDDAANMGTSDTSDFAVDTTIPSVILDSPANLSVFTVSNVTFNFTAMDSQSSTLDCSLFLDGVLNQNNPSTMVDTATAFQVSGIPDGSHSWYVQCTNAANNTGTSAAQYFTMMTGCPVISSSGTVTMTTNFFGAPNSASPFSGSACVKIAASNVVLDCNGFSINGSGTSGTSFGILVDGPLTNVTIRNCSSISGYSVGIYDYKANNTNITNVNFIGNVMDGIYLYSSNNNALSGDNVSGTTGYTDFGLYSSSNNVISNSIAANSGAGFNLGSGSNNNTLMNDIANGNSNYDFTISGSVNNMFANDTAYNASSEGFAIFSSNNTLANDIAFNNVYGFYISSSTYNSLSGDSAFNNSYYGFYVDPGSTSNNLANDSSYLNGNTGFEIYSSSNALSSDNGNNNTYYGFYLYGSNNTLAGCSATGNSNSGYYITSSSGNTIANSAGSSNSGIVIYIYSASNNAVINSTVTTNMGYGIYLSSSSGNTIANSAGYSNSSEAIYVSSGSNNTIINSIGTTNSGTGIYLSSTSNNTIINCTGNGSSGYGAYISFSPNNALTNFLGASNSGYGMFFYSSSNVALTNSVVATNSSPAIMIYYSSNDTVINSTGASNSSYGIYLDAGSNNAIINSTGATISYPAIFLISTSNNTVLNSVAKSKSGLSFYLYQSNGNNLTGDIASGAYGFYLDNSSSNQLSNDSAFNNSVAGLLIHNTVQTTVQGMHFFKNNPDLQMQDDSGAPMALNSSNLIFDNPSGSMQNYTNLSINDSLSLNEAYGITWTGSPSSLPSGQGSFAQKFVNITAVNGQVSINSISWSWTDAEAAGHNEANFALWKYNSSGWTVANSTPNTAANTISLTNIVPSSYGILQATATLPAVNLIAPLSGVISNIPNMSFSFNATEAVTGSMSCSLYIDSVLNQTNPSVQNATNTVFPVSGITNGLHNWNVVCRDKSNNSGSSATRNFTIDTSAPAAILNSPALGALLNASAVSFSFIATDNLASTMGCALFRDGSQIGYNASVQSNVTATMIASTPDGIHTWYVKCNDSANNTGTSATGNFTVDTIAPVVTLNSPVNQYISSSSTVNFNFTAKDNLSATMSCSIYLDSVINRTNSSVLNGAATIFAISGISNGTHSWFVQCLDNANNLGASSNFSFTVSTNPSLWANSSFSQCMNITIINASTLSQANFPALINLAYNSNMQSNYADLRFYSASCNNGGTLLPYEIDNYTASNALIWVGTNLNGANTTISVYYKNSTPVSSGQNATGVWNSNFLGVWHMTKINATDSTSNANNGIGKGDTLNSTGKIDGALNFPGNSNFVNCSNKSLHSDNSLTLEAWVNSRSIQTGYAKILDKSFTSNAAPYVEYTLGLSGAATTPKPYMFELTLGGTQRSVTSTINSSLNTWQYVTGVYNGSAMMIYVNGALQNTASYSGVINNYARSLLIGSNGVNLAQSWNGTIDEVRVSNTARSAQWINQSYQMENNNANWVKFGVAQNKPS